MARLLRKLHLAFTVLIGLPLVVWTVTGFAFTCFDFQSVAGKRDRAPADELGTVRLDVASAVQKACARRGPEARVVQVRIRPLVGRATYVVEFAPPEGPVIVDADSGELRDGISSSEARAVASRAFRGGADVVDVRLLTSERDAPDIAEPTYRVAFGDRAHTEVFVAQGTGEIRSWRNDSWRLFDCLWSLHVFGFIDRTSPAHWPLRIAGALAAIAALSGAGLLLTSLGRRLRRRARSAAAGALSRRMEVP